MPVNFDPDEMLVYSIERRVIRHRANGDQLFREVQITLPWVSILRLAPDAPQPRRLREVPRRYLTRPVKPVGEITRLLKQGHGQTYIAREVGCDPSYVGSVARKLGLRGRRAKG